MNKTYLRHIVIFLIALLLLNYFFQLHISIIGSLLLTVGLNLVFGVFSKRTSS